MRERTGNKRRRKAMFHRHQYNTNNTLTVRQTRSTVGSRRNDDFNAPLMAFTSGKVRAHRLNRRFGRGTKGAASPLSSG